MKLPWSWKSGIFEQGLHSLEQRKRAECLNLERLQSGKTCCFSCKLEWTIVGLSCSLLQGADSFLCPELASCEEGAGWGKEVLRGGAGVSSAEA